MEWQPISSAPRNCDVLVCSTHSLPDDEWETIQWVDYLGLDNWQRYRDRFDIPFPPSHWMHLPSPPKE